MAEQYIGTHAGVDVAQASRDADALVQGAIGVLNAQDILNAPVYSRVSTQDANIQLEKAKGSRDQSNQVIDEETGKYREASEAEKAALSQGGTAQAELEKANQQRAQQEADLYHSYALMFGIDTDPSSEIAQTAQALRQIKPVAEAKLTKVQQMQAIDPMDHPLDWLSAQISLPSAIQDYNREADRVNTMQDTIDKGIQTAQSAAQLGAKGIPTITEAQAKAAADFALADAARKKAQVDENLSRVNVDFASKKLASDLSIASASATMTSLEIKQNELDFMSKIQAINVADNHANRILRAAELMEKLGRTRSLDIVLDQYDKTMGHPPGTTNRYVFERMPTPLRENIVAIGAGSGGTNPYEFAINFANSRPGPLLSPETTRLFNFVQDKLQALPDEVQTQLKLAPKEMHAQILARSLSMSIDVEKKQAYKPGNIFYELSPAKMIAAEAVPPDSKLAQVLEPLTKQTGDIPTNVVVQAISTEWKNPTEAGQVVSDYYKRNMDVRNKSLNLGLAGIRPDTVYKVPIKVGPFSSSTYMDLTKPEEATKYLILLQRNEQMEKIRQAGILSKG